MYKWLEAVAWALADPVLDSSLADRLRQQLAETERLLRDAQQPDGYLDSHFQVRFPGSGSSSCRGDTSSTAPDT